MFGVQNKWELGMAISNYHGFILRQYFHFPNSAFTIPHSPIPFTIPWIILPGNWPHLLYVELYTPSIWSKSAVLSEILGWYITEIKDTVHLRAYDDYEHHTLKLTPYKHAGMGHFAWRTRSADALYQRYMQSESAGLGIGWIDHECSYGKVTSL